MDSITEITDMQQSDIEEVLKIYEECNLSGWTYNAYIEEIKLINSINFIARVNHEIAGFITARLIMLKNIQIICNDNECEIYNIGVKEPWRKIGIGNLLLKKVVEKSKKLNIKSIWLEVRESNKTAINFYQKHKFKEVHRRKNFYNNPVEQAIIMRLDIL